MELSEPRFHVVLDGRQVGPYDRRTIVGMRIRKTLSSADVLLGADGARLTVADLIGRWPRSRDFNPTRSGSYSIVHATYPASVRSVQGRGLAIPPFRGEVEARVQADVLRIAGRFRQGLRWRDDRVKLPLHDIVHAGLHGSEVELGLRVAGESEPQRLRLELFTPELAGEMVDWLPNAAPWPARSQAAAPVAPGQVGPVMLWLSVAGGILAVGLVLLVLLVRRAY
ncbi:MAG TPA: hypothetical protein VFE82_13175 [Ramlibacter sp.]|jgi:hypothetical protein|uniref:hypothetical protein n=1 Tax=Ramlibacter sp. TaxID=1917967 RepID=UPI002D6A39D1|nr:hypothetical protein [Ramlibacter sp.]HZY19426.1 hypothetical protein [Ramlibacter sp.]